MIRDHEVDFCKVGAGDRFVVDGSHHAGTVYRRLTTPIPSEWCEAPILNCQRESGPLAGRPCFFGPSQRVLLLEIVDDEPQGVLF